MNINTDNLEEIREMLEHAIDRRSWSVVEDALYILKEELGIESIITDED